MRIYHGKSFFLSLLAALVLWSPVYAATLDAGEEEHLIFMREEEKLARDVYLTLGDMYPTATVFLNISDSEQRHTDKMLDMIVLFGLDDPNPWTNDLPDSIGVFTGDAYGEYFAGKFEFLTGWGSQGLLDALYVGAYIEELDMLDINECPKVIVETDNGVGEGECGLLYTDERPLINSYDNLLEGSKDHLRAYVRNIEAIIGAGNYEAQLMTQEEVDAILDEQPAPPNTNRNGGGGKGGGGRWR